MRDKVTETKIKVLPIRIKKIPATNPSIKLLDKFPECILEMGSSSSSSSSSSSTSISPGGDTKGEKKKERFSLTNIPGGKSMDNK